MILGQENTRMTCQLLVVIDHIPYCLGLKRTLIYGP